METVVCVERAQCRGRMLGVVVAEFCHGKQVGPVGLLVIAVHAQVLFQHRIHPLRLAIRLLERPSLEVGGKNGVPIIDEGFRQAVNPDHLLQE